MPSISIDSCCNVSVTVPSHAPFKAQNSRKSNSQTGTVDGVQASVGGACRRGALMGPGASFGAVGAKPASVNRITVRREGPYGVAAYLANAL